jgi:16S rRNA G527 N7-methylase RsmG
MNINVYSGRAEQYGSSSVDVVTLRAVERFESILPIAAKLVAPQGRLALLISKAQLATVQQRTLSFTWKSTMPIPLSSSRILAVGIREP